MVVVSDTELWLSVAFLIVHWTVVAIATGLWIPQARKRRTPVNARSWFFFICFQSAVAAYGILIVIALFVASPVLEGVQLLVYPFFLQLYLWRLWQLFYLFHLTGERVKNKDGDLSESQWFIKHSYWIKNSFLIKSFVAVFIIQYVILIVLLGLNFLVQDILIDFFIALTLVYVILFIALLIKIRKVRDAFGIKREFLALGIWVVLLIVVFLVLSFSLSEDAFGVLADLFGLITYFGAEIISIVYPLAKSFKRGYSYLPTTTADDAESLDTLLDNEEMRHYFVEFLAKRFQVEYIFFLIQLRDYRRSPAPEWAEKAKNICSKYIDSGGELDLNVPSELSVEVKSGMNNASDTLFDKVEDYVLQVLQEPYSEFRDLQRDKDRLHEGLKALGI